MNWKKTAWELVFGVAVTFVVSKASFFFIKKADEMLDKRKEKREEE
jgi:hypothetical protein